jgi:hypothetical protein
VAMLLMMMYVWLTFGDVRNVWLKPNWTDLVYTLDILHWWDMHDRIRKSVQRIYTTTSITTTFAWNCRMEPSYNLRYTV